MNREHAPDTPRARRFSSTAESAALRLRTYGPIITVRIITTTTQPQQHQMSSGRRAGGGGGSCCASKPQPRRRRQSPNEPEGESPVHDDEEPAREHRPTRLRRFDTAREASGELLFPAAASQTSSYAGTTRCRSGRSRLPPAAPLTPVTQQLQVPPLRCHIDPGATEYRRNCRQHLWSWLHHRSVRTLTLSPSQNLPGHRRWLKLLLVLCPMGRTFCIAEARGNLRSAPHPGRP